MRVAVDDKPALTVRVVGAPGAGKSALVLALLEMPLATDAELARISILEGEGMADAVVLAVRGAPTEAERTDVERLSKDAAALFVAVHARDLASDDDEVREAWGALAGAHCVYLTATPPTGSMRGVDELRAALLEAALARADVPVDRIRRAKRPIALSVIGAAAMVTAAEGLLPGAAAFVVATQAGAISSLFYLYTGRWMGRTQALALLPTFAAEAAGGSFFLLAKSFLPPTGVVDVLAAGVAASMTIAVLGTIAWALDQGYSLEEREQLRVAFKKMRARTKAERKAVAANRHRWKDKAYWSEVARKVVFPS